MSTGLIYVGAFVGALAILVVFHELGHYLAARACNVKVLRFSVGFGRTLWARRFGPDGTEWAVCAVPLGGYVRMLDESEGEVSDAERPRAFNRQSVSRRAAIVAAGPLANLLLAVALHALVFVHGVHEFRPIIGTPPIGTAAAQAGLAEGSEITAIDGVSVRNWQDVRWVILERLLDHQTITVSIRTQQGASEHHELRAPEGIGNQPEIDSTRGLGLMMLRPELPAVIGGLNEGGPAALAGLAIGDRFIAVLQRNVATWDEFAAEIRQYPGQQIRVLIDRGGVEMEFHLVPISIESEGMKIGRIGVSPDTPRIEEDPRAHFVRYGLVSALAKGLDQTYQMSVLTLRMIGRMLLGQVSWKNVSGPVTMADYAGQSAQAGLTVYLRFLALISISLGVLNLLPIPILDGGHLLYYLIETVAGRPLPESFLNVAQRVGMAILGVLMFFAFYNDINRLVAG